MLTEEDGGVDTSCPVSIPDKRYFKIGEVCALTGVKQHVLRYWESEFALLNPPRARSKQRLYRREDIENVLKIKRLLKTEGFTITGAKKMLSREGNETTAEGIHLEGNEQGFPLNEFAEVKAELLAIKKILEE